MTPNPRGPGRWSRLLLPQRRNLRAEVNEELQFHLDMKIQQLVAAGMEPAAAREQAIALFGGVDAVRDACVTIDQRKERRHRRGDRMTALVQDIQQAWRSVRATPGFTAVVALTLAVGIGANTAIFSVVNGVLLKPLAYHEPERLVALVDLQRDAELPVSWAEFDLWRSPDGTAFSDVAALFGGDAVLTGNGDPVTLEGARISTTLPRMLGAHVVAGRSFLPEEEAHTGERVVMISDRLWRERYHGADSAVGRAITLNGNPWTVVGVYRDDPRATLPFGYVSDSRIDFWMPLRIDPTQQWLSGLHFMTVVARLAPGKSLADARAFMDRQTAIAQAADTAAHSARIFPLETRMLADVGRYLAILLGAVAFVLLIACVNVANLLLARGATRQRELAIRVAIGAGRARVISQLLAESVMRALLGGALGVGVAYLSLAAFRRYLPARLPRFDEVAIDLSVLAFLLLVSVATGVLFGLVPALRAARVDPAMGLREGGRGTFGSIRRDRLRRGLVVAEVALSFVLLVGAGLLMRSLQQMFAVPRGFTAQQAVTAYVRLPAARYPDSTRQRAFFAEAQARIGALPGVRGVAITSDLPVEGGTSGGIGITGVVLGPNERPIAEKRIVSTNYFDVLGARMVQGRAFSADDRTGNEPVVVVNETFVRRYLAEGGGPVLGRQIEFLWGITGPQRIVGVVADIKERDLNEPPSAAVYIPMPHRALESAYLMVSVAGDPGTYVPAVRRAVLGIDPLLPLSGVRSMDEVIAQRLSRERFATTLLGAFSLLALLLAAIGVYGVISYTVAQRRAEMGVRAALGASSSAIVGMVMRQGVTLVLVGVAVGVAVALFATRALRAELFGVAPTDVVSFVAAALVLGVVAVAATAIPSWRAARVDPLTALRQD